MQKNDLNIEQLKFQILKNEFPIFNQKVNGHPFIYFDSASTAQMPKSVINAISDYYSYYKANVGRGLYAFAEKATEQYENTRIKVAQFINATIKEIVFTSGTTDGINLVVDIWARDTLKKGDEIIISLVEHHSNFLPWQQLALEKELILTILPVNHRGIIDPEMLENKISLKTKLLALTHTSNILGSTNDVKNLTKIAHKVGAKVLIDAAQSIAHQKIDVVSIGCDFLVFSGHKLFGPTGVGVLFIASSMFNSLKLVKFGGGMVFSVETQNAKFKEIPYCFEAGTPPIAQVIGLGAALDFIKQNIDFNLLKNYETYLTKSCILQLNALKHFQTLSYIPGDKESGHLVTFYSEKYHAHDIATFLDRYGIAVRAGHHCVQLYHEFCKVQASVRVSFSFYNSIEEVNFLIQCLRILT